MIKLPSFCQKYALLSLCIVYMLHAKGQCAGGITTFPYVEDFETVPAWTAGGPAYTPGGTTINDWTWGAPANTVINSAGSGLKCWNAGGLSGTFYAYGERSYIQSPCFNFTNVVHPYVQFKIWWESEYKYDGTNLQYSLDNGTTWSNVGTSSDPTDCMDANWYNYNSVTNLGQYSHSLPGHGATSYTYHSLAAAGANGKNGWSGNTQVSYADTTGISGSTCQGGGGSAHWVTAKHCMPYLAGQAGVQFRFTFGAGTSCNNFNGVSIDSIAIGEGTPNTADFTYACVNTNTLSFAGIATLCPDTFQWNFGDPGSGASNTVLGAGNLNPSHTFSAPGTYNVTFTVKGGPCNGPGSITKTVHIIGVTTTPISVPCSGGSNGSIIAVVTGAASPYTYTWSTVPVQHTDTAVGLPAGPYTVTVTTANACSATASGTISQPTALTHTVITIPASCGSATGYAKVTEANGTAPYTYLWSNGLGTTDSIKNVSAGPYTLTVTDAHGCTDIISVIIGNGGGITATLASSTNVSCHGGSNGSITINTSGGSTPYTYHWGAVTNGNNTQGNFTAGIYVITVTDNNGCSATVTDTITQPTALAHAVSATTAVCGASDGSAKVIESGGTPPYSYLWSNGLGTADSIKNVSAGPYTLTVTDAHGCTDIIPITVTNSGGANATIASTTNVTCPGGSDGSITISATGGAPPYTYHWGAVTNGNNTQSGFSAGPYVITVTDNSGCITTVADTITEPLPFSPAITTSPTTCGLNNGRAQVTESGATPVYTYLWSYTSGTDDSIINVPSGNYILTVTDSKGCIDIVPVTIGTIAPPNAGIASTKNVSCRGGNDGSITISVTDGIPPYTYNWGSITTAVDSQSGFIAGPYTITVTDSMGCTTTVPVSITQPAFLNVQPFVHPVTCYGGTDGWDSAAVSGGTAPYTFLWSYNSQTTQTISNLTANTYSVTVTDANGCQRIVSSTVPEPAPWVTTSKSTTPTNCSYDSTGTADITVTGGSSPVDTYLWSNGDTTTHLTGLAAATYYVTVKDAYGCSYIDSVIIPAPSPIAPVTMATSVSCHNYADGSASASVTGGSPAYTYFWSVDSTSSAISNMQPGSYTVTVTDQHACTASATAVIGNPDSLLIVPTVISQSCADQTDGSVSLHVTGGTPAYSYQWSPVSGSDSILPGLSAGPYAYTVTDSHNCTASGASIVGISPAILPNPDVTDPLCPPLSNGSIVMNPSGGNPGYNYTWSNPAQTAINNQLGPGIYYLTITDSRGCTQLDTFTLAYTSGLSVEAGDDQTIDLGESVTLDAVTNRGGDISYIWSPDYNLSCTTCIAPEASPFQTFTYIINVSDTSGCRASDSVTIFVNKTYNLYVPNAFTPNGDGINDGFEIYGNKKSWKYVEVMIFDRWGEKVFESNDINFLWNGTYKGVLQEPNVYVYVLDVTFIDGYSVSKQKGSITLIR